MSVSVSVVLEDPVWDEFLKSSLLGEFQQSSAWARYKQADGWRCSRTLVKRDQRIAGGFQVLWRPTRFGRIGYVSKGPVAEAEKPEIVDALVGLLIRVANKLRLTALVVHPPGSSRSIAACLAVNNFAPNRILDLITSSLTIDLAAGMEAIEARIKKTRRNLVRQAVRRGVVVREGGEQDIGSFFQLMLKSCRRQGVDPNPSTEAALRELWEASRAAGSCRLTIAESDGRPVSGLFCLLFGKVATIWKKGSSPEHLELHAVDLLYHEALSWASSHGFRFCDFGSLSRRTAEDMTKGLTLSEAQPASRDFFHISFGGTPVLLPEAYLYFPNPLLRRAYRLLAGNDGTLKWLKKAAKKLEGG
jgi:lipid II:glycine glycyltransferase (peptidoglycan interpeptide bridge formation enzyme)